MDLDESNSAFEKGLGIADPQGRVVLQLALLATLYFERGHSLDARRAVSQCLDDYRSTVGTNLRWVHPGPRGFRRLDGPPAAGGAAWLSASDLDELQGWELSWHGGATSEEASHFMFRGLGARSWESERLGALSFISFTLPSTWLVEQPDCFPDMLHRFCGRLRPLHGYGGFGLVDSPNRFLASMHEDTVHSLAKRYPGLEIDAPALHGIFLKDGIKGVNWLTVLGERWLERLGGIEALRSRLAPPAELHAFTSGCLIRAGQQPQLGDAEKHRLPVSYGPIARALAPIRVRTHGRYSGRFDQDDYAAWLARLDGL